MANENDDEIVFYADVNSVLPGLCSHCTLIKTREEPKTYGERFIKPESHGAVLEQGRRGRTNVQARTCQILRSVARNYRIVCGNEGQNGSEHAKREADSSFD
jgi:hypothetical protein